MRLCLPEGLTPGCFDIKEEGLVPTELATEEDKRKLEIFNHETGQRFEILRREREERKKQITLFLEGEQR